VDAEKCETRKGKKEVENLRVKEIKQSEERSEFRKDMIWNEGIDPKHKYEETKNIEGEDGDAANHRFRS
jgi:hypothetical protein